MVDQNFVESVQLGEDVARFLERGQAELPLAEEMRKIASSDSSALEIVLVGLDAASRATVIRWLIGPQHHSITVKISESLGMLEIRLQERGYSLANEAGDVREFSQAEQFVAELERIGGSAGIGDAELAHLHLGLAVPPPLRNITISVLPSLESVLEQPMLLNTLTAKAGLLALAIPESRGLSGINREALRLLADKSVGLWPILVGETVKDSAFLKAELSFAGIPIIESSVLDPSGGAFLPRFITGGATDPVRAAIAALVKARAMHRMVSILGDRLDFDITQMRARAKREMRLDKQNDGGGREQEARSAFESLKSAVADDFGQLLLAVREQNRRSVSRSGGLAKAAREIAQSLHGDDLERTPGQKAIRLALKESVRVELRKRFEESLRKVVDESCILVRDSLDLTRVRMESALAEIGAEVRSIPVSSPDNRLLWDELCQAVEINISYRGEIQKRGFLQRLGHGRQLVFSGLMILSLVGSFIGFNFRRAAAVGIVLLLVFIGSVIYTYRSWSKEDEELIAKEIEKLNDSVGMELERMNTELVRELDARLQSFLDSMKRNLVSRIDGLAKSEVASYSQLLDAEKKSAKSKIKMLEMRERELTACSQKLTKARLLVDSLNSGGVTQLRQAIQGNTGVVVSK